MIELDEMVRNLEELRESIRHDLACMEEVDHALDELLRLRIENAQLKAELERFKK